jgi:hypothetical protein
LDLYEECYAYCENACLIGDSETTARQFTEEATFGQPFRVEPVTLSRIMDDFGYSRGEFAMEQQAFARFQAAAAKAGVQYDQTENSWTPGLVVIHVAGVKRHPD